MFRRYESWLRWKQHWGITIQCCCCKRDWELCLANVASTNGDPVRTAYLSINGGASTSVAFPSTGGFSTVGSLQKIVQLNAGNNTSHILQSK